MSERLGLSLLAGAQVGLLLAFAAVALIVPSWLVGVAGLVLLAREPPWRVSALLGLATLAAGVFAALAGAGASFGFAGRPIGGIEGSVEDGLFATLGLLAGPAALAVVLTFGRAPRPAARLARYAIAAAGLAVATLVLILRGERIAGIFALFAWLAFALVVCAAAIALVAAWRPTLRVTA